jgi:GntR family transcriptional regulator
MPAVRRIRKSSASQMVRADLTKLIKEGYFSSELLPSEDALANMFGVSRVTIREALANLENHDYISRVQGKGTAINKKVTSLTCRITEGLSFCDLLRQQGYTPSVKDGNVSKIQSNPTIAKKLATDSKELYCIKKTFLADGRPSIYCVNHLTTEHVSDKILTFPMDERSIFNLLHEEFDFPEIAYDIINVSPINVDKRISEYLELPVGTAMLMFESIVFDKKEEPVMYNEEYFNPEMLRFQEVRNTLYL